MAKRIIPHTLIDGEYIPHDAAAINDGTERIDAKRVLKIEHEITDQKSRTSPLKHGLNVVDSDQASVTELMIEGRTLVNLVPPLEKAVFDSERGYLTTENTLHSPRSLKIERNANTAVKITVPRPFASGYYIVIGEIYLSANRGSTVPAIHLHKGDSYSGSDDISKSKGLTELNTWVTQTVFFHTSELGEEDALSIVFGRYNDNSSFVGYLDGLRMYRVPDTEYSSVIAMTSSQLAEKYPFTEGMQHIANPTITKTGRNLLPPFYEWDYIHSGAEILSPYSLKLIAPEPGYNQGGHITIPALPNTDYTLSVTGYNQARVYVFSNVVINGSSIFGVKYVDNGDRGVFHFKSFPDTYQLIIYFDKDSKDSGEFVFESPQLELDIKATLFQPQNNDYLFFDAILASSIDGAVRDSVYKKNGKYMLKEHFVKDYLIDGNVNDVSVSQRTEEYTEISIRDLNNQLEFSAGGRHVLTDAYGINYPQVSGQSNRPLSGTFVLGVSSCWIRIPNVHSGWTESPTLSQIRDFLTQKPFKLTYQLKNPIEKELETEGAISLHKGPNLLTLNSGLILNEQIEPKRYNAANKAWYGINYIGSIETAHSPLQNEARRIVDIKADGKSVYHLFQTTSKGNLQNEVAYGLDYARIQESDFDPEASYTVTYFPLVNRTPPIEKSSITYQSSVSSSLDKTVEKLTDVETSVSVQANQLVELLARVRALDS
ncbi:hypothetical protein P8825_14475 [Shouchella clausii]|uniref:hypothetical protein n=1 Tax=Shouchella clausii TaxID=79880 RepID=UPI002DBDEAEF|nr:hypothetical protein [Shouchella clausii]MEB5480770.1 hypothetical protein [Shouchella clausii]